MSPEELIIKPAVPLATTIEPPRVEVVEKIVEVGTYGPLIGIVLGIVIGIGGTLLYVYLYGCPAFLK